MNGPHLILLVLGLLVSLGLVAGLYSARLGLSHLLVFLLVGMLAGVDGPLGLPFVEHGLAFAVGNLALAIILLDGGLRTSMRSVRRAWAPALTLATLGVVLTSAVIAAAAVAALGMDWRHGALLGAVVSSTDASAVFAQLQRSGAHLPRRVAACIELESGLNDPLAVLLTVSLIGVLQAGPPGPPWPQQVLLQLGGGSLIGLVAGGAMAAGVRALPLREHHAGLTALLLAAAGTTVYAAASLLDASGFLAVYLFGIVVNHRAARRTRAALPVLDGYTWLAQALMFLLLGLLVTPHELARFAAPGLLVAATLMGLARPLAVVLCLTPFRFGWRQQLLVAWVGLRGGVPIVLSLFPVLAGVPMAHRLFDIAFIVVLGSLLLQAPTIGLLARALGLDGAASRGPPHEAATPGPCPVPMPDGNAGACGPAGGRR